MARSKSVTEEWTWASLIYQFLNAATGGAKDRQIDIHALPGTFGVAAGYPNYYKAWLKQYLHAKEKGVVLTLWPLQY